MDRERHEKDRLMPACLGTGIKDPAAPYYLVFNSYSKRQLYQVHTSILRDDVNSVRGLGDSECVGMFRLGARC